MDIAKHPTENSEEAASYVKQHLIDPELCLRCGTCEIVCPEQAIHMDMSGENYVIDPKLCCDSHECLYGCTTDAIKAWRMVPADRMYTVEEQYTWEKLPDEIEIDGHAVALPLDAEEAGLINPAPASASTPASMLYTQSKPLTVRIKSNERATAGDTATDIHHIVLDFTATDFPWLEGQNIGVLPPGTDPHGHPHHMRAYSIASDRDGETPGTREVALTVKRVVDEWEGKPYQGVASNFLCDMQPGDEVRCIGPIGEKFLMPQDPACRILMIGTGTGIAPMRGFVQRQQRQGTPARPLLLFYGGRTAAEMAYYEELLALPESLLVTHMALSRNPDQPKRYVQDLLREQAEAVAEVLRDDNGYIFICGLISMEQGVMDALTDIAREHGLAHDNLHHQLLHQGRLQIETY